MARDVGNETPKTTTAPPPALAAKLAAYRDAASLVDATRDALKAAEASTAAIQANVVRLAELQADQFERAVDAALAGEEIGQIEAIQTDLARARRIEEVRREAWRRAARARDAAKAAVASEYSKAAVPAYRAAVRRIARAVLDLSAAHAEAGAVLAEIEKAGFTPRGDILPNVTFGGIAEPDWRRFDGPVWRWLRYVRKAGFLDEDEDPGSLDPSTLANRA